MIATYRLQLHPGFGFDDVRSRIPYFSKLGISHLYLSPITAARRGSTHGYDVVDHNSISEDLGGREAFVRLADACHDAGLEIIVDFVPNHAGVGPRNRYWQDVLAFGPHSTHARFFDIEWTPLKSELRNKILLPFLGSTYGEALDDGELGLTFEDGQFYATYYENRFAIAPRTYATILRRVLAEFERDPLYFDLKNLVESYMSLQARELEKAEVLRLRLLRLLEGVDVQSFLDRVPGTALHHLLERQYWRLSYWKTASFEINYRRFFDINELVALRMEDEHIFWDGHRLLGELLAHPAVGGVRIDHVDGLADPHSYLRLLREIGPDRIWVEKILAPGETLPEDWPVDGTTGYEFMNDVAGLLLDESARDVLDRAYRRAIPRVRSFPEEVYRCKKLVMETSLSSELVRLANELDRLSEADYHTRDFTLEALQDALEEIVASVDRYRTYLPHDPEDAADVIREAVYRAMSRNPASEPSVFEFVRSIILGDVRDDLRPMQQAWTRRFQQYCAPVAAKGVEDTAFYRYHRLVALNEVGGEPDHFGLSIQAFHSHARFRALRYPETLLATATHDHKRGEDTRMRLVALSELADEWEQTQIELEQIVADYRLDRQPSEADAYLFLQILLALWKDSDPEDLPDRIWRYMQKASRESKLHTSWIRPDEAYEEALEGMIRGMMADERTTDVLEPLTERLADLGFRNSLTQVVLKFTTPGVPDIYQGTELWDLSLVDPDNRREVDYDLRARIIDDLEKTRPGVDTMRQWIEERDVRIKLHLMVRLLQLRASFEEFTTAEYRDLEVESEDQRWLAFARVAPDRSLIVAARRHFGKQDESAAHLHLPDTLAGRNWVDVLSGEVTKLNDHVVLNDCPLPWLVLAST